MRTVKGVKVAGGVERCGSGGSVDVGDAGFGLGVSAGAFKVDVFLRLCLGGRRVEVLSGVAGVCRELAFAGSGGGAVVPASSRAAAAARAVRPLSTTRLGLRRVAG
ncbi:MAG: hypothetical protein RL215_1552 [Planctomycetota bacterium]